MYAPTFAISFVNMNTGEAIMDCGTSPLKTAKGAARNWYVNLGHIVGHFVQGYHDGIYVIVRPIQSKADAICMNVENIPVVKWIEREQRNGATVLTLSEILA
jgi:hypothetical protein